MHDVWATHLFQPFGAGPAVPSAFPYAGCYVTY